MKKYLILALLGLSFSSTAFADKDWKPSDNIISNSLDVLNSVRVGVDSFADSVWGLGQQGFKLLTDFLEGTKDTLTGFGISK